MPIPSGTLTLRSKLASVDGSCIIPPVELGLHHSAAPEPRGDGQSRMLDTR
jgi:hypothetical protein